MYKSGGKYKYIAANCIQEAYAMLPFCVTLQVANHNVCIYISNQSASRHFHRGRTRLKIPPMAAKGITQVTPPPADQDGFARFIGLALAGNT